MSNIFDFDASVTDGWAAFRAELQSRLTGLQAGDTVRVTAPNGALDGHGPTALFTITPDDEVRCHISPTLLGQDRDLDDGELSLLMELEWDSISERRCVVERGRDDVEHIVRAAGTVMQELWQVLHPTFLLTVQEWLTEPVQHIGVQPTTQSQLHTLVDAALERVTGFAPNKDADGDIVFIVNDVTSWLHVDRETPVVELFANISVTAEDSAVASAALMDYSRQWPDIRFYLIDQFVRASIRMDATVVTDAVLRSTLTKWFDFLTDGSGDVAAVVDAASAEAAADEDLPTALMCILQLDDEANGPLSPHEIAKICDFDRDVILYNLRVSEEQRFSWRSSISDALERGEEDEAAACEHEEKAWLRTVNSLRTALRVVVLSSNVNEVG